MENKFIRLVCPDICLSSQAAEYYKRNRRFLEEFEPVRKESFFTEEFQRDLIEQEISDLNEKKSFHFYIQPADDPHMIIGMIGLNNVIWGPFCSAFLGYKLDESFLNQGYMSMAVDMVVGYAFNKLHLHRIEANVMPKNIPSLKVLEHNHFINEGLSKYYLKINGIWEDHLHMVRINYDMHR